MSDFFLMQNKINSGLETYLYNEGDERTALTGGWSNTYTQSGGTYTENADNFYLYASGYLYKKVASHANKIDLTNYSKIWIDWTYNVSAGTNNNAILLVNTSNTTTMESGAVASLQRTNGASGTRVVESLDISSLTGEYYIGVMAYSNATAVSINTYKIWLE